jgi:hypothetical protein
VLLVAGALGLPEAGLNLNGRRATGFRWFVVPIHPSGGEPATIRAIGSRTQLVAQRPGLFAVVCVGYARRALTDPYEVRVELPGEATLTLEQYEYLMNLLVTGARTPSLTRRGRDSLDRAYGAGRSSAGSEAGSAVGRGGCGIVSRPSSRSSSSRSSRARVMRQ